SYEVRFSRQYSATTWYGGGESRSTAVPVELEEGSAVTIDPVALTAAGTLRGVVRVGGVAKSSVQVTVLKLLDGQWVRESTNTAYTGTGGAFVYRLSTLLPVKLYVQTGTSGARQYRVYHGEAFSLGTATPISVAPGETVTGADIDVPASGTLTGAITNSHGGPLSGGVTLYVRDHGQVVPLEHQLSISTSYTQGFAAAVPAGRDVTFAGSSKQFTTTFLGDVADPEAATFTTVLPGGTRTGLEAALPGGAGVRGRLVEPTWIGGAGRLPAAGVELSAWWNDRLMSRATSDANGYFRLPGLSYYDTPRVHIRVDRPGLEPLWLRGFDELTADRAAGSTYGPEYDGADDRLSDIPVPYPTAITSVGQVEVVNQVAGKPLTVRLPEWSTRPDRVALYLDVGWLYEVTTLADDFARVVEVPWFDSLEGAAVYAVASKDGMGSGVASGGLTRTTFAATTQPRIIGTVVPGQTLGFDRPVFNATPDRSVSAWVVSGRGTTDGSSYQVTQADVGRTVMVRVDSWFGTSFATARSVAVPVATRSALSASARVVRGRAEIAVRLATPGVARPGGTVRVLAGGKVLREVRVGSAPVVTSLGVAVRSGVRRLTVAYSGSRTATSVSKVVRVRR
ncbi:MAG TPA: hypothetical protein VD864_00290, partial [Nocardioides sp.]|nr:hypothetical protein [Nocardioides sp.]